MQTVEKKEFNSRQAARVAGISLVVMFFAAIFAEFFFRQQLIVPNDAAATAQKVLSSMTTFRFGMLGFIVILVCDMIATWALYYFFKNTDKALSQFAAWCRLLYTAIFALAISQLFIGFRLLQSPLADFSESQMQGMALQYFANFDSIWAVSFIFFAGHLLLIGILSWQSGKIPKWMGVLIFLAGIGYLADNLCKLLAPNYADFKDILAAFVAIPAILGELGLAIWLLWKRPE